VSANSEFGSEYVSCRKAQQIGGVSRSDVLRLAVLNQVRTQALPGQALRFHLGDIRKAAESNSQPSVLT
jgi:hypothetical protein